MNLVQYCHNHGSKVVPTSLINSIYQSLEALEFKEKPRSAPVIRELILKSLSELGWTNRVPVAASSKLSITGMNGNVGLCLQFGNMARFYADLLKLQTLHKDRRILSALYIIPTRKAARILGANIANFDRMTDELKLYQNIITVPILVLGLEGENK